MMKKILQTVILVMLTASQTGMLYAGEVESHRAYRITSYNLGADFELRGNIPDSPGANFQPLLITSTKADILNNQYEGSASWDGDTSVTTAPTKSLAVSAQYDATQKVSLQGAFGITRNLWTPDIADYESESGWEANLGIIYKVLNNLSYEMHFGYMDTGKLFSERSSYTDVENIIMISNRLTMSF